MDLMNLVQPSDIDRNLYILPGGTVSSSPTELLARDSLDLNRRKYGKYYGYGKHYGYGYGEKHASREGK